MIFEIWFGDEDSGLRVNYSNDIWIDSLLNDIEYLRKNYPNKKLWLKRIDNQ
jgi:hypothetical protein